MEVSFGARLRQQREQQQLDLAAIAARMKIKASLLEELERDDVSHWPAGIYRRAYLRDYARAIGLDPEPWVREFMELYPDPMLVPAQAEGQGDGEATAATETPTRFRRLLGAVPLLRRHKGEAEPVGVTISRLIAAAPPERVPSSLDVPPSISIDEPLSEAADLSLDGLAPTAPIDIELDLDSLDTASSSSVTDAAAIALTTTDVDAPAAVAVDLVALADVCARLARASHRDDVTRAMGDAARLVHAAGLMIWSWDARRKVLTPSLAHGYSDEMVGRLPSVRSDAPNAIAAAFRSAAMQIVDGPAAATGAIAAPLIAPDGCVGVLALEVESGREREEPVRSVARIVAAQLASLLVVVPSAEAVSA